MSLEKEKDKKMAETVSNLTSINFHKNLINH